MPQPKLLLFPGILGRATEVFLYRHATGLARYLSHVAATEHRNLAAYPHPRVHLLDAKSPVPRLGLRISYALARRRPPRRERVRAWRLAQLAARLRPDVIHVHFLWNACLALEAADRAKVPLVVTAHGTDVNTARMDPAYRESIQPIFQRADRVLAVSDFMARTLVEVGCSPDKVIRLYLGAPLPATPARPNDDGKIRVICVSGFRPGKGHAFLVQAFAQAARQDSRLRLVLVGDGAERRAVEACVAEAKISDRVTFAGSLPTDDVGRMLAQSHIYAQHSVPSASADGDANPYYSEEALGISFVEAAGHGLPLVATRVGGVPEICRDGVNGCLVEPHDICAMAERIVELASNPERRAKLGAAGRRLVEAEFDQRTQFARLEELYDRIIAQPEVTRMQSWNAVRVA